MSSNNISGLLIIILIVWTFGESSNAIDGNEKNYDSTSVEQNQKILRLLLRLAFHTANHLVRLKDADKIRSENEVDKDLQNITMKDIMQGVSMNRFNSNQSQVVDNELSDIQGRFLNILPPKLEAFNPMIKMKEIVNNIASGNTSDLNVTKNIVSFASGGVEVINNLEKKGANVTNLIAGQISNPQNLLNLTNVQDTMGKLLTETSIPNPIQAGENLDLKNLNPAARFLSESNDGNTTNTTVPGPDKVEGNFESIVHNLGTIGGDIAGHINQSSSTVNKREASVPVSVSHVKNQTSKDHISVGNFSTSNITDSTNGANIIKGDTILTTNSLQPRINADKDNGNTCVKDTRNIYEYIFDDDIDEDNNQSNGIEQFEEMKLQDFSNQIINLFDHYNIQL